MDIFLKALIGAAVVVVIQLLTRSRNYYIAGLAPLFPTLALISHYLVGSQRTTTELKTTIDSLQETIEKFKHDTSYIEKYARENLGMAKEGEKVYKFLEEEK